MQVETLAIEGLLLFTPLRREDERGVFAETFRQDVFERHAGPVSFVQDNQSRSHRRGTIRGLHYQAPPRAQGKLVRVLRGSILDVAVDARAGSPTYGRHVAVELDDATARQLWVPAGFLHGFCTLVEDTEVAYKVTDYYSAAHDGAVAFDDPDLAVAWPCDRSQASLSDKDRAAPRLQALSPLFPAD